MKKPNIFEGRTKEWNSSDWQGRSKKQVESSAKVMGLTVTLVVAVFVLYGLFSLVTYVLG